MIKTGQIIIEAPVDVICDICNKSCVGEREIGSAEYSKLEANWGYYSSKDGERWEFCFCEDCSLLIKDFVTKLQEQKKIA